MNNPYLKNRSALVKLMYSLRTFTERELRRRFSVGRKSIAIDAHQTIGDFLDALAEQRILRVVAGVYTII